MNQVLEAIARLGQVGLYLFQVLRAVPGAFRRPGLITNQIYFVGAQSLVIIVTSGLFVGMVLGLQGHNSLAIFGAEERLGTLTALSLFRELGPVVTALLFAGRAGTSIAAEIGLMGATNQLEALDAMAIDPMRRVIAPRFIAGVISLPVLVAIFNAMGILGAFVIGVRLFGIDAGYFWAHMIDQVDVMNDIVHGMVKACVFGVIASLIAVFEGATAPPTGAGVAQATTQTVVYTAMTVLAADFLLTAFLM